jgi:hypothetical protein
VANSAIPELFTASARHILVKSHASGEVAGPGDETVSGVVASITTISVGVGNDCSMIGCSVRSLIREMNGASDECLPSHARVLAKKVARTIAPTAERCILSAKDDDSSRRGGRSDEQNASARNMTYTYKHRTQHQGASSIIRSTHI